MRWWTRRDTPEVLWIEEQIRGSAALKEEDSLRLLEQLHTIGMVEIELGKVVGFIVYSLYKNRIHIETWGVHPMYGDEILERMFHKMKQKLKLASRHSLSVEVSEKEEKMHFFLRKMKFLAKNVTVGDDCDNYWFVFSLKEQLQHKPRGILEVKSAL